MSSMSGTVLQHREGEPTALRARRLRLVGGWELLAMAKRAAIPKSIRFEVFKRDGFKCQYCGMSAPDVILHVDHIDPVSKGGGDEIINLVTSCVDCNLGKSDRKIGDQSIIEKQRQQLAELNERREQLEMMLQWREGLSSLQDLEAANLAEHWSNLLNKKWVLNENGVQSILKVLRKFGYSEIVEAMSIAVDKYVEWQDGAPTKDSVSVAWSKVPRICTMRAKPQDEQRLYYIRGIVRGRMGWMREDECINLLREASSLGVSSDYLAQLARQARNWSQWEEWMLKVIKDASKEGSD